ncbi:MAG: guanosine polyphosphate pyrophosphohydrolase [Lachnospiraceae bacterium]|nr:guanosine polyphosphate pyrophosphohydrolase [Lachnospiraceae bacterium]
MILLNDYLYDGNTVLKILHEFYADLKESAIREQNGVDLVHSNILLQHMELLRHNDFLTSQSQRIREFYKYMAKQYPFLAFTFKGRIKSLIRLEEKINGNIVDYIYEYYLEKKCFPTESEIKSRIGRIRDLIAYRIVLSLPKCHIGPGEDIHEREVNYLYEIANNLPGFLEEKGFSPELSGKEGWRMSEKMNMQVRPFYRDYILNPSLPGYQSLHISFYDNLSRSDLEVQLRTKEMDDYAEIGLANHLGYEERQKKDHARRDEIPVGMNKFFDEAYERVMQLQKLDFAKIDVNMFGAVTNHLINDGCGLYKGRLILPYEHLSRFQNDLID